MTITVSRTNLFLCVSLLVIVAVGLFIQACAPDSQVRFEGYVNMGTLPSDVMYDSEGFPQIVISTESDGDIIMSYLSDKGVVIGQMYSCEPGAILCQNAYPQGAYFWDVPGMEPSEKYQLAPADYNPLESESELLIYSEELELYERAARNLETEVFFTQAYRYDEVMQKYLLLEDQYFVHTPIEWWVLSDEVFRLQSTQGLDLPPQ